MCQDLLALVSNWPQRGGSYTKLDDYDTSLKVHNSWVIITYYTRAHMNKMVKK